VSFSMVIGSVYWQAGSQEQTSI